MTEVEQPPQNGIDLSAAEEDDSNKARPADIEQDMREMERRKRVEAIMSSKLFREELERIVDSARDGGTSGILQQLSDIVGMPASRVGSVFKASNCMMPINDIRGVESMGYAKGEKILRCKLAATFRLLDLYGWTQGLGAQISARLKVDQEYFLVNPYGLLYHEITASSLNKVDMQGQIVEQGTTNFGVNKSHFILHSVVHAARPDIRCAIYIGCSPVVAVSSLKTGLLPLTKDACVLGEISTHAYAGLLDSEERDKLVRNLGPNSKVILLSNHGALCCGETIEEAFFAACHIVQACEIQLKLLPVGVDNLVLIPEESRKTIYEQARRPPEDLEKKFAAVSTGEATATEQQEPPQQEEGAPKQNTFMKMHAPKWRVGGAEFEALMRMLDNAGYRTGYIYRHPLIKSDPPKPKNDVELPPAVSSLGYLLEEEELFRQGIWKRGEIRKGGDRSRWLNSPNVYQKVEVLETGTPDPKKITKWVAEGSPTHSTPVRIEDPLQFVPAGTNPKEFKRLQQQIKDNRRADKISAGPQSHILEGVTWDEANRIKDATVSSAGDHVVLMGAASKGIIQRGFQHNATVYKMPYAKNPFDNVTDDELNEYKRTVERKKKSNHSDYSDMSDSEALSSQLTSGAQLTKQTTTTTTTAAVSQSEPEDVSEHQVMRIETQQAPIPSQPEVVLSDATLNFINGERSHTILNRKPPTGRDKEDLVSVLYEKAQDTRTAAAAATNCNNNVPNFGVNAAAAASYQTADANKENIPCNNQNVRRKRALIAELRTDALFQRQKQKFQVTSSNTSDEEGDCDGDGDSNGNENDGIGSNADGGTTGSIYLTANETNNTNTNQVSLVRKSSPSHNSARLPSFERAFGRIAAPLSTDYYSNVYDGRTCEQQARRQREQPLPLQRQMHPNDSIYEAINDIDSYGADAREEVGNIYKKSIYCYTPAVCDLIFASLQKPQKPKHTNDLIFNIPFLAASPTSTLSSPCKTRADSPNRPQSQRECPSSPYRTVSHFGFNSPQREPQPDHKHIPEGPTERKMYVPLHRAVSYEEIFSSPRYVDLCECCFERIVRLKPELQPFTIRLHNTTEFTTSSPTGKEGAAARPNGAYGYQRNNGTETSSNYEYIESTSSDTSEIIPAYTSQLEPLLEVEEGEFGSSENANGVVYDYKAPPAPITERTISNSTFISKITRLNYSEESTNVAFLQRPRSVSSNISLGDTREASPQNDDTKMTDDTAVPEVYHTITEIWDFDDWMEQPAEQSEETREQNDEVQQETEEVHAENPSENANSSQDEDTSPDADCTLTEEQPENDVVHSSSNDNAQEMVVHNTGESKAPPIPKCKYSMLFTGQDENGRRVEFVEYWQDHMTCLGVQQLMSENESSVHDEKRPHQQTEVFHGRSNVIIKKATAAVPHTVEQCRAEHMLKQQNAGRENEREPEPIFVPEQVAQGQQHEPEQPKQEKRESEQLQEWKRKLQEEPVRIWEQDLALHKQQEPEQSQQLKQEQQRKQGLKPNQEQQQNQGSEQTQEEGQKQENVREQPQQDVQQKQEKQQQEQEKEPEPEEKQEQERDQDQEPDQDQESGDDQAEELGDEQDEPDDVNDQEPVGRDQKSDDEDEKHKQPDDEDEKDHKPEDEDERDHITEDDDEIDPKPKDEDVKDHETEDEDAKDHKPEGEDVKDHETEDEDVKDHNPDEEYGRNSDSERDQHTQKKRYQDLKQNHEEEQDLSDDCYSSCTYDVHSSEGNLLEHAAVSRTFNDAAEETNVATPGVSRSDNQAALPFKPSIVEFELYRQNIQTVPEIASSTQSSLSEDSFETCEREIQFSILADETDYKNPCISDEFDRIYAQLSELEISDVTNNNIDITDCDDIWPQKAGRIAESHKSDKQTENKVCPPPGAHDKSFSAIEREILKKIEDNQLKGTGQIFDKIEATILNKLTPSKLELLTQQYARAAQSRNDENIYQGRLTSTPKQLLETQSRNSSSNSLDYFKIFKETDEREVAIEPKHEEGGKKFNEAGSSAATQLYKRRQLRRSRSMSAYLRAFRDLSPPSHKMNRTTTPPLAPRKKTDLSPCSSGFLSHRSDSGGVVGKKVASNDFRRDCLQHSCKRNFILENIRNAAKPRGNYKRVAPLQVPDQGNAPKNISQSCATATVHTPSSTSSSPSTTQNSQNLFSSGDLSDADGAVFPFQSKLVRGSPRFWVSMSPSSAKRFHGVKNQQKLRKKMQQKQQQLSSPSQSSHAIVLADNDSNIPSTSGAAEDLVEAMAMLTCSGPSTSLQAKTAGSTKVDASLEALGEQIEQIKPRLETYKRKLEDYGEHMTKCARNMDECEELQKEIVQNQKELREDILLNQYSEEISCKVQTYSISGSED